MLMENIKFQYYNPDIKMSSPLGMLTLSTFLKRHKTPSETVKEAMFKAYVENNEAPAIKLKHLIESANLIVPLAITMNVKIDGLRKWASTRARPASSDVVKEELIKDNSNENKLTKREKEEDIF